MSEGTRLPLSIAEGLASNLMAMLLPFIDRLAVAGSVRRRKADVGDIEIVCIPRAEFNLLGESYRTDMKIEAAIYEAGFKFIKNGERFKQFDMGPCKVDLFITTPECWGMIYTIRTGSAEFSHRLVTPKSMGGLLPSDMQVENGRIKHRGTGQLYATPEEEDVFSVIGLEYIPPEMRL